MDPKQSRYTTTSRPTHHHHPPPPPPSSSSESSSSGSRSPASPASPAPGPGNTFKNDGSFMEMFKRKMEEERRRKEQGGGGGGGEAEDGQEKDRTQEKKPPVLQSFVGKRRGGVALKTGMVAKKQKQDEKESGKSDAWSKYMAEVKKYKAHQCGDDDKTRPLVK